jgi:hypothetical protein
VYFVEIDMSDDVCEDLTREDSSFVGWEAIKRQGKQKIGKGAAYECVCFWLEVWLDRYQEETKENTPDNMRQC